MFVLNGGRTWYLPCIDPGGAKVSGGRVLARTEGDEETEVLGLDKGDGSDEASEDGRSELHDEFECGLLECGKCECLWGWMSDPTTKDDDVL